MKPGNASLPIGDGAGAQNANREIGVPRVDLEVAVLRFLERIPLNLGYCPAGKTVDHLPLWKGSVLISKARYRV